jgi:hypothetical protein
MCFVPVPHQQVQAAIALCAQIACVEAASEASSFKLGLCASNIELLLFFFFKIHSKLHEFLQLRGFER